ncbi:DUF1080 domain-containing protein [Verrucomicrobiales bacterium]|jgi:hypothetical protein|nr:DUF1080 domain-containing protein [Verrucomicrobiales bacterium]
MIMRFFTLSTLLSLSFLVSCGAQEAETSKTANKATPETTKKSGKPLFDGESLKGWKKIEFGGTGDIEVEDGEIILYMGELLTGLKWDGEVPYKSNYEISLDAQRIDGVDFFCALTFPIAGSHSTFVVGGWGGALVGISSIDDMDASENSTGSVQKLEDKQWYNLRVRVTDTRLDAWIDKKQVVKLLHTGRRMGMRFGEIEECVPIGIATFQTKAAIKNIRIKSVEPDAPGNE